MEAVLKKSKSSIYSAILKHGRRSPNFKLEILEYCEKKKDTIKIEQYYLDLLKPEYNILKNAGSWLGRKHSAKTLCKMGAWVRSEETLCKMSASKMGNSNSKIQPNAQQILVTDLELNTKTIYKSMRAAARALNIRQSSISNYLAFNRTNPFKKRYLFTIQI
jgi:group I intron endonuclease